MGADDGSLYDLTAAEREQYLNSYIPGKLNRGEVPRSPLKWREASAHFRTQYLYGHAVQKGIGIVFGLEARGAVPEQVMTVGDRDIRVDWRIPGAGLVRVATNLESKAGAVSKDRDLQQLRGYAELLAAGENVVYVTRAAKENRISPEVRKTMESLQKTYPGQFRVMAANEKVFNRILEAGVRAVERERQEKVRENASRVVLYRDPPERGVAGLAQDYVANVKSARAEGKEVGIDQLRFVNDALRDLSHAHTAINKDADRKARKELKLRFHESKDLETHLDRQERKRAAARMIPVDELTLELSDREREELAKSLDAITKHVDRERLRGRSVDPRHLEAAHVMLGNSLGAMQKMEMDLYREQAAEIDPVAGRRHVREMAVLQAERDARAAERIEELRGAAERERKVRERGDRGREQEIQLLMLGGLSRENAERAAHPSLYRVNRDPATPEAPMVTRAREDDARGRDRGLGRER